MLRPLLAAALLLAGPAAAQVATPRPSAPQDLLARPDTYPGSDIELPVAAAPGFRPAVPGCVGIGLPERGYGDVTACYDQTGQSAPRPGFVVVPLD